MDQIRLQSLIGRGLALCGSITGGTYLQYRPTTALDPISVSTPIATLNCAFDFSKDLQLLTPTPPGHPFVLVLVDPGRLLAGDLLVGADTYFISRVEALQPAWAVLCNATVSLVDTAPATSPGANSYGGQVVAANLLVASGWPASMLAKNRGEQDVTKLPSDTRAAYFEVYLPAIPGFTIGPGLELQDQNVANYTIMSFETTDFGWKLIVGLATS